MTVAAAARSVRVADLAGYHATAERDVNGLVIGYGNRADGAVADAVHHLGKALRDH